MYQTACRLSINKYFSTYSILKHREFIKIKKFGEQIVWRAPNSLPAIVETDLDKLDKQVQHYVQADDIEGIPTKIKFNKKLSQDSTLKYSQPPIYWAKFVTNLNKLDSTTVHSTEHNLVREDDIKKYSKSTNEEVPPEENQTKRNNSSKTSGKVNTLKTFDIHSVPKTKQSRTDLAKLRKSSDQLITEFKKTMLICDNVDTLQKEKKTYKNEEKFVTNGSDNCESSYKGKYSESRQNGRIMKPHIWVKPPNILVFADSQVANKNIKTALSSMVNKDKYAIYDLPTDPNQTMWNNSTVLVVACGTIPLGLTTHLLKFFLSGGQLLCLCSDLLSSILHRFATAKVREHELVRFTYDKWKVNMMHDIFGYRDSLAEKQSKDPDHSNLTRGNGLPSIVEIQHNEGYIIQVQVLGMEETWHTPSLLLATVKDGDGRAVFSQVHLEIDPNQYRDDETKFAVLKDSDQARLEIFKDILINHFEIDCCSPDVECDYSPAYFLGRHEAKMVLLAECKSIRDKKLETEKITLKFCNKDKNTDDPSASFLPVLINCSPTNFSTVNYFENLKTEHIGRLVIYSDAITSTQYVLSKKLEHGLAVITRQQTQGQGRSSNIWLSPLGCAPCSLQVHIQLDSPLGKVLPLVQHLATLAIVSAIRGNEGSKDLDIGIKWPNDVYVNGTVKIGGILINSFVIDNMAIVAIGFGVNLNNANPTLCINEIIRISNETKGTNIKTIPFELYFASLFNEFEKIFKIIQAGDIDYFYELYYSYWLHNSNNEVFVTDSKGVSDKGKIIGIDNFGFLRIRREDGSLRTVHPDGNRFDMLSGLVYPKT